MRGRSIGWLLSVMVLAGCAGPPPFAAPSSTIAPTATTQATTTTPPIITPEAVAVPAPEPSPCGQGVDACVRLSTRQAWLGGGNPVPMMPGGPGFETPTGTYSVQWKAEHLISDIYGLPMPHSVFFAPGGIAFHEGSLSEPSHGCVHLAADVAKLFFDSLGVGASVQVLP